MIPYASALLHFQVIMLSLPQPVYAFVVVSFLLLLAPAILRYIFEHLR